MYALRVLLYMQYRALVLAHLMYRYLYRIVVHGRYGMGGYRARRTEPSYD